MPWLAVSLVLLAQLALLVGFAARNRFAMNPDGVAYLGIARHYAEGNLELAVSAYWGPMLSWLCGLLLSLGLEPLFAARTAMVVSALVFALGSASLLRAVGMGRAPIVVGTALAAMASVGWSLELTPDLLMSGLLVAAFGQLLGAGAEPGRWHHVRAGLLVGAASLAKPVALPVGVVAAALLLLGRAVSSESTVARAGTAFAWVALGALLTAGPWIGVISFARGQPTIGTSGAINHALVAPPPKGRHPFLHVYHRPDPGRVTQWEDPSDMAYAYWSPIESAEALRHQLSIVADNAAHLGRSLLAIDRFGIGTLALGLALLGAQPWRRTGPRDGWRWAVVPALVAAAVYLPLFAKPLRYVYPLYPLMVAASLGLVASWWAGAGRVRLLATGALVLALASLTPGPEALQLGFTPVSTHLRPHVRAAERLGEAGLLGPIAGVGGVEGLYVAHFGRVPFYGSMSEPPLGEIVASGAALVVVASAGARFMQRLERDPRFESLDGLVFRAAGATRPFRVYAVRSSAR